MEVLVFGAAGFVGQNLVHYLKNTSINFIASDIVDSPFDSEVEYRQADINDSTKVEELVKDADYVVNLAVMPLVPSLSNPIKSADINITGSLRVLDAARKYKIKKIIFPSASSVIGIPKENPVKETHPCIPQNPYSITKYAMEHYIRVYKEIYDLDFLIFRFFNLYGPRDLRSSGNVVNLFIAKVYKGQEIIIYGDGSAVRDFIYIGDVVEFLVDALGKNIKNEIINLGRGKPETIRDVLDSVCDTVGVEAKVVYRPPRQGDIGNFYADTTKLRMLFNKIPTMDLDAGIKKTFAWYLNNLDKFAA